MNKCPICESNSSFLFNSKHNKKIYHCTNEICGHFFTPILKPNQGICARPEDIETESNEFMLKFDERNQKLLELFLNSIGKDCQNLKLNLLDYGAGNAHISRTFKNKLNKKANIYCVDKNPNLKDLYKKYNLIHIQSLEEIKNKIDLIYLIEVIEHIEDPINELKKLAKILKPEGKIFITTPVGREKENTTNAYDTISHLHFFSEKSLNLTLKKAGLLEIDEYKYYPQLYATPSFKGKIKDFIEFIYKFKFFERKDSSVSKVGHLVGFSKLPNNLSSSN